MAEKFHIELKTLKKDTLAMSALGRLMLRNSVDALIRQDKELAATVIARKDELHKMEVRIEEHCYQLIALNQPMAKDMRVIACTLKVITASMRIGRYGKVIANIVKDISDKPHIANLMSIPHMADLVIEMIDDAVRAYETDDLSFIEDFSSRDDTIDALRHSIFREGITYMMEDPKNISRCTHYIMVARYLERCADHACKIAENVHYMQTGERIEIH
ncbi:phosphate signaling complex protein PhoU [Methanoregula sp.]|jgi:phosphate transport system protein|uniref:phosphate signaling complex protein PhoU n=1 Tax=Methanoregula sp. TaxID=2052170 RepID=UPI003C1C4897